MTRSMRRRCGSIEDRPVHAGIADAAARPQPHSALAPANLTTLAHFSVSSATSLPKSAGEPVMSEAPSSPNRTFGAGSARIALIVRLSLSTISGGVPLGAPTPYHALDS